MFTEETRIVKPYTKGLSEQYRHVLEKLQKWFSLEAPVPSSLYSCIQKIQLQMLKKLT